MVDIGCNIWAYGVLVGLMHDMVNGKSDLNIGDGIMVFRYEGGSAYLAEYHSYASRVQIYRLLTFILTGIYTLFP